MYLSLWHTKDIHRLIDLFNQMVENGNTLFIIEHNLDIIKSADYIIEMGPGAGEKGGKVIFTGTPQQMMQSKDSVTAKYL